jgi:regulator of protease activity HflC (stomatin/prohibitin superfamily)
MMGALTLAVVLGLLAAGLVVAATGRRAVPNYASATRTGLIVLFVVLLGAAASDSFTQVEAGSVAVVKQFGEVQGVFSPGLNWKVPFIQQVIRYRTQEIIYETSEDPKLSQADYKDVEVDTATSDGQMILARFTVRFRIDPTKAMQIVSNLGTEQEMVEKVVKATSRVHVRNILKQHVAADLYSGNVERAQDQIAERLTTEFAREGIQLVFFGLRSVQFQDDYRKAVEAKQIESENIKTKENLAKQAEFEKQRTVTQAQGEAERQKLEKIGFAEGEAESIRVKAIAESEAIRIKAQAQSEANKLIAASLDPNVISWQAVQQWSGQYPTVMGGSGQFILPGELFVNNQPLPTAVPTVRPLPTVVPTVVPAPAVSAPVATPAPTK